MCGVTMGGGTILYVTMGGVTRCVMVTCPPPNNGWKVDVRCDHQNN